MSSLSTIPDAGPCTSQTAESLAGYYRWHSRIYDLTRWSFLFGRQRLIQEIAACLPEPRRILEIGCGTGRNLVQLAQAFPQARLTGLDLSQDMLDCARPKLQPFGSRISLLHQAYAGPVHEAVEGKFDLIVFSYSLSMINPGFDEVLRLCVQDLAADGHIAVVDFHTSRWPWFRRWMGVNHVRMEGQVLTCLNEHFALVKQEIRSGYGQLWEYLLYLGKSRLGS